MSEKNNKKSIPERIWGFVEKADKKFAKADPKDGSSWASSTALAGVGASVFMAGMFASTGVDYAVLSGVAVAALGFSPVKGHTLYYKGIEATGKAVKKGYRKVKDKVLKRKDMSGTFLHAMNNVIQNGFEKIKETAEKNREKVNHNPFIKRLSALIKIKNLNSSQNKPVKLKDWDGSSGKEVLLYEKKESVLKKIKRFKQGGR